MFFWNGTRQSRVWTHSVWSCPHPPLSSHCCAAAAASPKLYNLAGCSAGTGLGTSGRLEVGAWSGAGRPAGKLLLDPQPVPDQLIHQPAANSVINRQIAIDLLFLGSLASILKDGFGGGPRSECLCKDKPNTPFSLSHHLSIIISINPKFRSL